MSTKNLTKPAWSHQEMATAATMYQDLFVDVLGEDGSGRRRGAVMQRIAQTIGRARASIEARISEWGPSFGLNVGRGGNASARARAKAERSERQAARERQDLTAAVMGDPPPGFSALDKRRQGVRP